MGGNTRHFATLVDDLEASERFEVRLINTSRGEEHSDIWRNIFAAARTLFSFLCTLFRVDIVSYHASNRGVLLFGPFIVALGKLFGKPTVVRIFGGSFGDFYRDRGPIARAITKTLTLSADVVLLQTKRSVEQLREVAGGRVEWFSTYIKTNVRSQVPESEREQDIGRKCRRFVFLGHLWRVKGLETLLDAAPALPPETSIDIFGPLDEYSAEEIAARGHGRVRYCGFLTHSDVDRKLWNYDCLVLPTFHPSEGYPGVIVEAFAHGIPVISTRWLAIPEIVDASCGILIEVGDTQALVAAITNLYKDRSRWLELKDGAKRQAVRFEHDVWSARFEEICEALV